MISTSFTTFTIDLFTDKNYTSVKFPVIDFDDDLVEMIKVSNLTFLNSKIVTDEEYMMVNFNVSQA